MVAKWFNNMLLFLKVNAFNESLSIHFKNRMLLVKIHFPAENQTYFYKDEEKFERNTWVNLYFHVSFHFRLRITQLVINLTNPFAAFKLLNVIIVAAKI